MSNTRKKMIAGNWKMNNTVQQSSLFISRFSRELEHTPQSVDVVIAPSFVSLQPLAQQLNKANSRIKLAAQTIHQQDQGTFTGEVSGSMLSGIVDYVIVGHSERRLKIGEHDKAISQKVAAAVRNNLNVILCVGETFMDRDEGHTNSVLHAQLASNLSYLTAEEVAQRVTVAYEPVWAISSGDGHGQSADPSDIQKATSVIRSNLKHMFGAPASKAVRVLYGGSTNPDNTRAYLQTKGVDGLLVGGASLNYKQFAQMVTIAKAVAEDK